MAEDRDDDEAEARVASAYEKRSARARDAALRLERAAEADCTSVDNMLAAVAAVRDDLAFDPEATAHDVLIQRVMDRLDAGQRRLSRSADVP